MRKFGRGGFRPMAVAITVTGVDWLDGYWITTGSDHVGEVLYICFAGGRGGQLSIVLLVIFVTARLKRSRGYLSLVNGRGGITTIMGQFMLDFTILLGH